MKTCEACGSELVGRQRRWCSVACRRRVLYSKPCPLCGRLMDGSGGKANSPTRCRRCSFQLQGDEARDRWAKRMQPKIKRVLTMVAQDYSDSEIAEAFGTTTKTISQFLVRLRRRGYDVPNRSRKGGHR